MEDGWILVDQEEHILEQFACMSIDQKRRSDPPDPLSRRDQGISRDGGANSVAGARDEARRLGRSQPASGG
eukprot:2968631-Pyramimonas_sp.AAC.1